MLADKKTASLTLTLDGAELQRLALAKERITIGRRSHNDLVLEHPAVSAEHAAIITIRNDSFLEDLNSTNGTLVNGQPVKKHFLQNGDVIELARYLIHYRAEPQEPAAARGPRLKVVAGAGVGRELPLTKPTTSIGRPGVQVAVILEQADGYGVAHIEGELPPLLNGKPIGISAMPLAHGDIIDLSGTQLLFVLG